MRASLISSLLCLVFAGVPASGQAPNEENPAPRLQHLFNLKFEGGTVPEYVQAIRKQVGPINVSIAPEAIDFDVPGIELTNVSVPAALRILHQRESPGAFGSTVQLMVKEGGIHVTGEAPIYAIGAFTKGAERPAAMTNRVWSVADFQILDINHEDTLTAIEIALQLIYKTGPQAELRFHEATGILIARATAAQLDTIQNVIEQLREAGKARKYKQVPKQSEDASKANADHMELIKQLTFRVSELEKALAASTSGNARH